MARIEDRVGVTLFLILLVGVALFNAGNAYAAPIVFSTPNPVTQPATFDTSGVDFPPNSQPTVYVYDDNSGSCSGTFQSQPDFTDDSGDLFVAVWHSSSFSIGTHCIAIGAAFGSITVGAAPTTVVVEPYSVCVISLGVEQSDGTVMWLPGYSYPGTPISQCKNMTDVSGQDVLGRTIVSHQFIVNGTSYKILP